MDYWGRAHVNPSEIFASSLHSSFIGSKQFRKRSLFVYAVADANNFQKRSFDVISPSP